MSIAAAKACRTLMSLVAGFVAVGPSALPVQTGSACPRTQYAYAVLSISAVPACWNAE